MNSQENQQGIFQRPQRIQESTPSQPSPSRHSSSMVEPPYDFALQIKKLSQKKVKKLNKTHKSPKIEKIIQNLGKYQINSMIAEEEINNAQILFIKLENYEQLLMVAQELKMEKPVIGELKEESLIDSSICEIKKKKYLFKWRYSIK